LKHQKIKGVCRGYLHGLQISSDLLTLFVFFPPQREHDGINVSYLFNIRSWACDGFYFIREKRTFDSQNNTIKALTIIAGFLTSMWLAKLFTLFRS